MQRVDERELKRFVLQSWHNDGQIGPVTTVASELVLGSNGRRVDLAFLDNEFVGVEIKSSLDSLSRLEVQLATYVKCFDRVILVVDECHTKNAIKIAPNSVSLWECHSNTSIRLIRKGKKNRLRNKATAVKLLTNQQIKSLVGVPARSKVSRPDLLKAAQKMPAKIVYNFSEKIFHENYCHTSNNFWDQVGEGVVDSGQIALLSPSLPQRIKQLETQERRAKHWHDWRKSAEVLFASSGELVNPLDIPLTRGNSVGLPVQMNIYSNRR